jgi:7,8-dihydropterin-6-yl-methyl-4-(beta-D-ribofuranosyl)aminobenzene 5'-phosphate synthase
MWIRLKKQVFRPNTVISPLQASEIMRVKIKITALMDNIASEHKGLIAEHGLSYYIETEESKILFDCGGSIHPFINAKKMNLSFEEVHTVVFSHGHYDHAAGFIDAVDIINPDRVVTGKDFFEEKYAYNGTILTYLGSGFDRNFLQKHNIEHIICEQVYEIDPNCYVLGNFERMVEFESISERFVVLKNGQLIQDDFHDEVCLVIKSNKGLVVVLGCSHPGVLNILRTVQRIFKSEIYAVFGGTHLVEADESRIQTTLDEMKTLGVELICMSHCSGNQAIEMAKIREGIISTPLTVGSTVII